MVGIKRGGARSDGSLAGAAVETAVYGYVLLQGAGLLADGSELLLEVVEPGIIGGAAPRPPVPLPGPVMCMEERDCWRGWSRASSAAPVMLWERDGCIYAFALRWRQCQHPAGGHTPCARGKPQQAADQVAWGELHPGRILTLSRISPIRCAHAGPTRVSRVSRRARAGVVLPVLGALPDALIVGVAGLGGGSAEEVQHDLAVGIGTLAGSTARARPTRPRPRSAAAGCLPADRQGACSNRRGVRQAQHQPPPRDGEARAARASRVAHAGVGRGALLLGRCGPRTGPLPA